jgi:pimeloyl-ACP methyl ester carboxylesterase
MITRRLFLAGTAAAGIVAAAPGVVWANGLRSWRHYVDCRFGQMHFRTAEPAQGAESGKPPLVCLHESPQSGLEFLYFQPVMATDRRVLCPDLPGYGASDGPYNQPEIDEYAGALADALTALGYGAQGAGPVDILGFHTGTVVACSLAVQRPDLVRRLVIPGTPYFPADVREKHRRQYGAPRPYNDPNYVGSTYRQLVLKLEVPSDSAVPQRDGLLPLHRRYEMFVSRLRPGTRSHFGFEAVFRYDLDRTLAAITQPVLLPVLNEWLNEPTRHAASLLADSQVADLTEHTKYIWDLDPVAMANVVRPFLDRPPRQHASVAAAPRRSEFKGVDAGSQDESSLAGAAHGPTRHWRGYVNNRYGQLHIRSARPARAPESDRTPLILLHPNPVSSNAFKELLQVLGTDRTVHAPDMPGFGDSDSPNTQPTITDLARVTAEALSEIGYGAKQGRQVDVFGVEMGAFIATELAAQMPGLIRRVVLCRMPHHPAYSRSQQLPRSYDFFTDPDYVDRLYKRIVETGDARLPFQRRLEHFTDHMLTCQNGEWADRAMLGFDARTRLRALARPTLLMAFDDESTEPTAAARSLVSKSRFVRLRGVSGQGFMSHAEEVAHAVRQFLDS